jgi:biotin carboxylase
MGKRAEDACTSQKTMRNFDSKVAQIASKRRRLMKMTGSNDSQRETESAYEKSQTDRVAFIHRGYGFCAKNTDMPSPIFMKIG